MSVTIAVLAYKSPKWLNFVLDGIRDAKNQTSLVVQVVGVDPQPSLTENHYMFSPHWHGEAHDEQDHYVDFLPPIIIPPQPELSLCQRVYGAWNLAAERATTSKIIFLHSDMFPTDWWVDELMKGWLSIQKAIPVSRQVQPPGNFNYWNDFKDFGYTPDTFDKTGFLRYSDEIRLRDQFRAEQKMYQPVLFDRDVFRHYNGYSTVHDNFPPESNANADQDLSRRMEADGYRHVSCYGSVVYHVQQGEANE